MLYIRYQSRAITQFKNTVNGNENLIWPHPLLTRPLRPSPHWKEIQNANCKNPTCPQIIYSILHGRPSSIKYLNQPHKINHWQTCHSSYHCHCNVVLSYLFIYLSYNIVILFYHIYSSTWSIYSYHLHIYILDFTVYMHYYLMWF